MTSMPCTKIKEFFFLVLDCSRSIRVMSHEDILKSFTVIGAAITGLKFSKFFQMLHFTDVKPNTIRIQGNVNCKEGSALTHDKFMPL